MSCFFCESSFHLSHNCDVFASIESKKQFLRSRNLCEACLQPLLDKEGHGCHKKCYICFSKIHHTVFCSEKSSHIFLPKIDVDLFPRFLRTLNIDEQYSIAFLCPTAFTFACLKSLFIIQSTFSFTGLQSHKNCNFLIPWSICIFIYHDSFINDEIWNTLIIRAKTVSFEKQYFFGTLNAKIFLHLLTPYTKSLRCHDIDFTAKITFSEILQKIPNIEMLDFENNSNFEIGDSWLEDLMRNINGNNFRKLKMQIDNLNFDAATLAEFMKTKMCKDGKIILQIRMIEAATNGNLLKIFNKKIQNFFVYDKKKLTMTVPKLKVEFCTTSFLGFSNFVVFVCK